MPAFMALHVGAFGSACLIYRSSQQICAKKLAPAANFAFPANFSFFMLYFLLVFNKFHKLIVIIFLKSWMYCIFFDSQPILYSDSTSNRDGIYRFGLLPFRFSWRFDLFYCFSFLADSVFLVFSVSLLSLRSLLHFQSHFCRFGLSCIFSLFYRSASLVASVSPVISTFCHFSLLLF